MKKKILIIVAVIIVIAVIAIGYMVISDMGQEKKLNAELEEISTLVNAQEMDVEQIEEKLNRTVTNGDYAIVENAFKQYLSDNFNNIIRISEILNDEKIVENLTAENYEEDGPDFVETKAYISETKQELEDCKAKYVEFFTEKKAMSYITDKGLDEYYIEYYKNEVVGDIESANSTDEVEASIDEVISILDVTDDVIDFLIENKDNWQIEDDVLVFDNESLSNQYDELIAQLQ